MSAIHERLKEIRLDSNLKQKEIEALSGFLQKDISKYEAGVAKFIPEEYILFWYKKGYNLNWLYTGKGGKRLDSENNEGLSINEPALQYSPGVVTVDAGGRDNMVLVPVKAQAGYVRGMKDPEYFEKLPALRLPKYTNGIFRAFEVSGYSMLTQQGVGLHPSDIVVGRYVERLDDIRDNKVYIIVNDAPGEDDIVIKRCLNTISKYEWLLCKSDNRSGEYHDLHLDPKNIKEVWEWKGMLSAYYPNVTDIHEEIDEIKAELSYIRKELAKPKDL